MNSLLLKEFPDKPPDLDLLEELPDQPPETVFLDWLVAQCPVSKLHPPEEAPSKPPDIPTAPLK